MTLDAPYERLKISGVEIRLRNIGRTLNLERIHPHKFRRTMATILTDEFEEYLELINSLSYRELEYLLFFKEFSDRYTGKLVHQSWNEFSTEFRNKFQNRDAYAVYKRLQRTGFISEVIETANIRGETLLLDNNFIGFEVEPEFNRFNEMVLKKIDNT